MHRMPILAAIAICVLDLILSALIYFAHSALTTNFTTTGNVSVAGDFIFFRGYYGQILAQAILLALWLSLIGRFHLIGVLISAHVPFLLVSWYGFGATPTNFWELYLIGGSLFGKYDLLGGGLVLVASGIFSYLIVRALLSRVAPNKGFNRTPVSSAAAKPGEFGGGAG